mmetsp:Transcript_41754/g.134696  ORF Transcript_41754/g.134696 Transcript_41754/m.134696 type:complete len:413 (+) Transcript_41754:87-1325(+)
MYFSPVLLAPLYCLLTTAHHPPTRAPRAGVTFAAGPEASKPLLVCTTAPSLEGVAFCKHALQSGGWRVRALVRNLDSPRAATLAQLGAELVQADNLDEASLRRAFAGAHGIYGITTWSGASRASDGSIVRPTSADAAVLEESEVEQGRNILRAARATDGLQHFVWQSMHRGGREPVDPAVAAPLHHRAKWRVEDELVESDLPWSVLRQPTYLENFGNSEEASKGTQLRLLRPGVVSGLVDEDIELSVIAVDDLGALATAMFARRDEYLRRTLAAAAERVNGARLAEAASRVHGRMRFAYKPVPWFVLEYLVPVDYPRQLRRWLTYGGNDEGARADAADAAAECRRLHPEMLSVEEWMRRQGVADLPLTSLEKAKRLSRLQPALSQRLLQRRTRQLLQRSLRNSRAKAKAQAR